MDKDIQAKRQSDINANNKLFQKVFRSPDGAKILQDLLDKHYKHSSFVRGESETTAFNEGQRSVVIYILQRIEKAEKQTWRTG